MKFTPALATLTLRMPVSSEGTEGEAIEVEKRVEKRKQAPPAAEPKRTKRGMISIY